MGLSTPIYASLNCWNNFELILLCVISFDFAVVISRQGGHAVLKVFESRWKNDLDLESSWKHSRALKILDFGEKGPWKSLNGSTL